MPDAPGQPLPAHAHPDDAGLDLRAAHTALLEPGQRQLIGTGVAVAIPAGHVGLIHPRSGLALRHGVTVLNTPGTVDAGYRGELKVLLVNLDPAEPFTVAVGDRIAQLVIQRYEPAVAVPVTVLPDGSRAAAGFGSTGRA